MFQEDIDPFEEEFGFPTTLVTKLTLEEIEIALSFLKRRFPRFSIQKIVSTLDHYNYQKTQGRLPKNHRLQPSPPDPKKGTGERYGWEAKKKNHGQDHGLETANILQESKQDRKAREEENLKLVARLFCEGGDDYKLAKRYIPQLSVTSYRNMLLSIANTALKQLMAFLRKQCSSMKGEQLSQPQKVTIKTAIICAHEWMGTKSLQAIETLFKLISNKFSSSHKPISKKEALELYSVIARRVNHSDLDLSALEPQPLFGQEIQSIVSPPSKKEIFNDWEQTYRVIAQSFLEECNLDKMSSHLIRKYGILKAWEKDELQRSLRRIVQIALDRLITTECKRVNLKKGRVADRLFDKIMQAEHLNIKYALVQLYLNKLQSRELITSLGKQINSFIDQANNESSDSQHARIKSQPLRRTQKSNRFIGAAKQSRSRILDDRSGGKVNLKQRIQKVPPRSQSKLEVPSTWEDLEQNEEILYFEE